jgi:hypothetical protein
MTGKEAIDRFVQIETIGQCGRFVEPCLMGQGTGMGIDISRRSRRKRRCRNRPDEVFVQNLTTHFSCVRQPFQADLFHPFALQPGRRVSLERLTYVNRPASPP